MNGFTWMFILWRIEKHMKKRLIYLPIITIIFFIIFPNEAVALDEYLITDTIEHLGNEVYDVELSNIDWMMDKQGFLYLIDGNCKYTEYNFTDGTSVIEFNSYLFSILVDCTVYFDNNENIFEVDIHYPFEINSPLFIISKISSELGCPDFYSDSYEKKTDYNSYYMFHIALWKNDLGNCYMYTNDIELYYYLHEDEIDFDNIINDPIITVYPSNRIDEAINDYQTLIDLIKE